jgi:isopenicillin N synthase-like dioxygenase
MNIPVLNLEDYRFGSKETRSSFSGSLGKAFEETGFVAITNHGIDDVLIDSLYGVIKKFFSLPLDFKRRYEISDLHGQRGYTSFGKEHAKGSEAPDLKEFFQYGQLTESDGRGTNYPSNVMVHEIPEFNPVFENAFKAFETSGSYLLAAIADYLQLSNDYFESRTQLGNSILRAIHYPPITHEPKSSIRAEQHEDINLITLLVGASADGLEILTKDGHWMPVKARSGQIIVNVGDMLQRLTNNRLRSTTHRVVNPPRELWHTSRFSVPFFLHPCQSVSLACLDSCISSLHPKIYEDVTAGEYLDERLREIGLKK